MWCGDLFGEEILDLRYYHFTETELDGIPVVVTRTGWTSEVGYEIYLLRRQPRAPNCGRRSCAPASRTTSAPTGPVDIRRVEGGIFNWGADMTYENNPYEMGLDRLVSLDVDCVAATRFAGSRNAAFQKGSWRGDRWRTTPAVQLHEVGRPPGANGLARSPPPSITPLDRESAMRGCLWNWLSPGTALDVDTEWGENRRPWCRCRSSTLRKRFRWPELDLRPARRR